MMVKLRQSLRVLIPQYLSIIVTQSDEQRHCLSQVVCHSSNTSEQLSCIQSQMNMINAITYN